MVKALTTDDGDRAARLVDGVLVLDGFLEDDPTVLAVLKEANDGLESGVHTLLGMGARLAELGRTTLDTAGFERVVSGLADEFGETVADAVTRITTTADELVGEENGTLSVLLRQVRNDLASQLETLFDEDSKTSALARMEVVFATAAETHARSLKKAFDPTNDDSPLGRMRADLLATVSTQCGLVLTQLTELASGLSAQQARNDTMKLTAIKGFPYEDQVHAQLERMAIAHGDLARQTGHEPGTTGRWVGDEVVELAAQDTNGRRVAMTFEAKHQALTLRKTNEELDLALTNREAAVAVAVFASQGQAPTSIPFSFHRDKAVCVYDPDDGDERALWLAYMWARMVARRSIETLPEDVDIAEADGAIVVACEALGRITTVKGYHTKARNSIDLAASELDAMRGEVDRALGRVRTALG
jgi:hypothetical protein